MGKEITLEMDPELLEKIETSPFEMEDLFDLACILSIEANSINKMHEIHEKELNMKLKIREEKNEIYKDLEKAKKDKAFILNKYKGIYQDIPLFEATIDENNQDYFVVEEFQHSGGIDYVNFILYKLLLEIQLLDTFNE